MVPIRSLISVTTTSAIPVSSVPVMTPTKPAGLFLTPGASGAADHPVFVQLEEQLDVPVERYDFEYHRAGRRSPPKAEQVVQEATQAVTAFAEGIGLPTERIVVGGRSFGGRVCSLAVADGLVVAGLALLSYPLHPPGKPDALRADHFGELRVPVLFVSGDRDPFMRPDELAAHVGAIPGPVTTVWIEGGTHDPRHKGREQAVVDAVRAWMG
jgi:predicted alpha/beta-hydrolase family hydrolase